MKRGFNSKTLLKSKQNRNVRNKLIKRRRIRVESVERLVSDILSTLFSFITITRVMILMVMVTAVLVSHYTQGENSILVHLVKYLYKYEALKPYLNFIINNEHVMVSVCCFMPAIYSFPYRNRISGILLVLIWCIYSSGKSTSIYILQSLCIVIANKVKVRSVRFAAILTMVISHILNSEVYKPINPEFNISKFK
jgi:hypothetical protein